MNIQLKQRLVGAVVLVSLAVIIIPMLLPGEGEIATSSHGIQMPAAPDYRFSPLKEAPPAPELAASPPLPQETLPPAEPVQEGASADTAPAQQPATTTQPDLPVAAATPEAQARPEKNTQQASAWVVQVGSFSRAANAHALRDKLRKQGYSSFVEAVKDGSGRAVYRVRVGPEVRRDLANKRQQQLKRDVALDGIVLRYP